jgi:hypothetical protein
LGIWCGSAPDGTPFKVWWSILDGAHPKVTVLDPPDYASPNNRSSSPRCIFHLLQNPTSYSTWEWDAPNQRMIVSTQIPVGESFLPKGPRHYFVRCDHLTMGVSSSPYAPDRYR